MFSIKFPAVLFIAVVSFVYADNSSRLIVHQAPSYQHYSYDTTLKLSDLKSLLLAINGFTVDKEIEWTGLKSTKPTAIPKFTLLFLTDSNKLDEDLGKSIQIEENSSVDFDYLKFYLNSDNNGLFMIFDTIPSGDNLNDLACEKTLDSIVYVINADKADDLKTSVNDVVESVKQKCTFNADDLMVYILGTEKHLRVRRDVVQKREVPSDASIVNLAVFYSDNYPVMFHLLFWTSLVIGLTVIAITCGMYKMDPGLDTVIYRMTSQRIKKDN